MKNQKKDNTLEIVTHFIGIFAYFFGALLVFLLTKDRNVKKHATNALNWQISFLIYSSVVFILSILSSIITNKFPDVFILFPFSLALSLLTILNIIFCLIASFKASDNILWKYPLSINFVSKVNPKDIEKGKKEVRKALKDLKKRK